MNSGNAVIGIQDPTSTVGFTPPNRNTGSWSASQEAWRFTPVGAPNYSIEYMMIQVCLLVVVILYGLSAANNNLQEITYLNCNLDSG